MGIHCETGAELKKEGTPKMSTVIQLGIQTYFSPDDDTQQVFLDFLNQAQHSIYIAIYAFHLPLASQILLTKRQSNLVVAMIMDRSQAHGHYERTEVRQLMKSGIDVTIGDSQKHHIMHHKFAVVDTVHVLAGSWNFSEEASLEDNYIQIVTNQDLAQLFLDKWRQIHDWIHLHEPQDQFLED